MSDSKAVQYEQEIGDVFQAMAEVHKVMNRHNLDHKIRHLIHLRASQMNGCAFCIKMHTREAREDGESNERIDRVIVWNHVSDFNEREKAALAWTEALTEIDSRADLGALRARLRQHFSDKEIGALTAEVAAINFWNRIQVCRNIKMSSLDQLQIFETARPRLLGLAYRILGSRADAEDAVQDTFLKWQSADASSIDNPAAWLTTICTRQCLDLLRAAHRSRVNYVGSWLPEPIHLAVDNEAERNAELSSSLTTAFLLILERLTPKERAAYLLHEIFELPYPQIASTLDLEEAACRKLVSRAKQHVDQAKVRHVAPSARQDELLSAFQIAITQGETSQLSALLSDDIRFTSDGGGKVAALLEVLHGRDDVLAFIRRLHSYWSDLEWRDANINGTRGVLILENGAVTAAISFAFDNTNQLSGIYVVRNPDKLAMLDVIAIQ